MSYMLLIVEAKGQRQTRTPEEGRAVYQRMVEYGERLKAQQLLLATNSLREAAVRINVRGGKANVLDGPFTEAKELIGGFFLLNCASREQALRLAQECPAAEFATIEVRETGPCYD
jgi:hypothetical protein